MPTRGARIRTQLSQSAFALVVALAGGAPLYFLHVPGGQILGGMAAAALLALRGRVTQWPGAAYAVLAGILGVASGASVTSDTLKQASVWPLSIALLFVGSTVMCLCGYAMLRAVGRFDRRTAFYSVAPGALQTVLILAEEQKADLGAVGIIQTLRMVVLLLLAPTLLGSGAVGQHPAAAVAHGNGDLLNWAVLAIASLAGLVVARRLRWPSADFLGPMVASALLHVTGVVTVTVPIILMALAGACMGVTIGAKFAGMRLDQLGRLVGLSVVVLLVMGVIAALFGALAGTISHVGPVAGVLAFAPGSLDAMIALALTFHAEPAYVAVHHLSRFMMLLLVLPFLSQLLFTRGDARRSDAAGEAPLPPSAQPGDPGASAKAVS